MNEGNELKLKLERRIWVKVQETCTHVWHLKLFILYFLSGGIGTLGNSFCILPLFLEFIFQWWGHWSPSGHKCRLRHTRSKDTVYLITILQFFTISSSLHWTYIMYSLFSFYSISSLRLGSQMCRLRQVTRRNSLGKLKCQNQFYLKGIQYIVLFICKSKAQACSIYLFL